MTEMDFVEEVNEDIIIDPSVIANGVTPLILEQLITWHERCKTRYERLFRYYKGNHSIEGRVKKAKGVANTKIICNHAKYITDMATAYLVGNEVTYEASKDVDIEALKDSYTEQDISAIDSEIVKNMCIFGKAYELIYRVGDASVKSAVIDPCNVFAVYDNSAQKNMLFVVHYYRCHDLHGRCIGSRCFVYDGKQKKTFTSVSDGWANLELAEMESHHFGGIPIIEYRNNAECQGDFEQLIPLIDAYNTLQSDRLNDKEQFVDSFLFLVDVELDSEDAKKLADERILMGYAGASAEYLSKVMSEADIKVLRDDLKEDIHRFSMVPDLSDESFGNNLSGVAIKYKLMGFEQHVKNKERYLAKGLKTRFELYNSILALRSKMSMVDMCDVDIVFTRNLPVNELETAQMINNLRGVASNETLLARLPFIKDAKEEQEFVDEERNRQYLERIQRTEGIAKGGGYSGGSFNQY